MGVNKSITIEGGYFPVRGEVEGRGYARFSLSSDAGEEARAIMSVEDGKEVVDAIDTVRGWVKPMQGRPYTEQELKF